LTKFLGYRCSLCKSEYGPKEVTYTCPRDGGNLDVIIDFSDFRKTKLKDIVLSNDSSLWRYLPILPVDDPGNQSTPLRVAGWTPMFSPMRLKTHLSLQQLWIKDESRNPTASFKDRASAVVVARAREIGAEVVVTASTGNAGAALAGMAAAIGQKAVIFAPKDAPSAKIAQLLIYGAEVFLVDGSYDDAFDLSVVAAQEFGWYCRNTGYNPFTVEGKKTAAFEIWECLLKRNSALPLSKSTMWKNRMAIFVSVGDGNIISGIHKGFKDLQNLGLLEQMPRIHGVQSEGSAAIANAFRAGSEEINPVSADTIADSISVDMPRDGVRAVRAATQTGGSYIKVTDNEILDAIATLGENGIFAEPAGAASYAGLVKAVRDQLISPDTPVVVINTGSGLKDVGSAIQAVGGAQVIEPSIKGVKRVLK